MYTISLTAPGKQDVEGFPNTGLLLLWEKLDPECNAETPLGPKWPFESPDSSCLFKATVEWILTPGVVEEGLKFVVLTRLVTSVEEAVKSRALTRFPRMSGFSYMENIDYLAKIAPTVFATRNILTAEVRLFAAILHIAMTGTCAFFLAVSMFSPGGKRWYMKQPGEMKEWIAGTRCFDKDGEDTCRKAEMFLQPQTSQHYDHILKTPDDAPARAVLKDAGEVKTIGLPQPLRNLITLPLSAARLLGKGDLEEKYECPVGAPQAQL
ncbi:hypothetical protein AK812_SmicGene14478 [Symbiodinium microadriaticum]|uniref:Uncharacterized protein n=1 Tax=Symbiodinium microadriaticum TaxID=2951 RepID=A0A1Q9E5E6_SYMMI|nr:hypothetical protein AK812_SmicGene14478 [Symbiodinium microadriaticum]